MATRIIDCDVLRADGLWTGECCVSCHTRYCEDDSFEVDIDENSRLSLCCRSGSDVALTGADIERLRQPRTASQAR